MRVRLLYIELSLSLAIQQFAKGTRLVIVLVTTFPSQYDIFVIVIKYPSIFYKNIKLLENIHHKTKRKINNALLQEQFFQPYLSR